MLVGTVLVLTETVESTCVPAGNLLRSISGMLKPLNPDGFIAQNTLQIMV